jgi:hypothetical protein
LSIIEGSASVGRASCPVALGNSRHVQGEGELTGRKFNVDGQQAPWKNVGMPKRGNRSKKKVKNRSKTKRQTLKRNRVRRRRALRR